MKRLTVCLVSMRALPLFDSRYEGVSVTGGAEINMYNLAVFLVGIEGIRVKVAVDDFGQPAQYIRGGVEIVCIGKRKAAGLAGKAAAAAGSWRRLYEVRADAFIFTTSSSLLGELVLIQRVLRGRKVIFRLSSDLNLDMHDFRKKNGFRRMLLYRFGLKNATTVVSQTEKQQGQLAKKYGITSRVIPNGFFVPVSPVKKGKDIVLWVGRCMHSKKPMLFLKLAGMFPDRKFVMIMPLNTNKEPGVMSERKRLYQMVHEAAGYSKNIEVIDFVPYRNIQGYFERACVYVCTSDVEGFPNTFIQACLAGTPILSFYVNPDRIIQKYRLGCFCSGDFVRAQEFIRSLDDSRLESYGRSTISYVRQHHGIENTAGEYIKLIDSEAAAVLKKDRADAVRIY